MKKTLSTLILAFLLFGGCNESNKKNNVANGEKATSFAGDSLPNDPAAENMPYIQPDNAVKALILAAQNNNKHALQQICDSEALKKENSICNNATNGAILEKLKTANVTGDININGSNAEIPVVYNTGEIEIVKLVLRNDAWKVTGIEGFK